MLAERRPGRRRSGRFSTRPSLRLEAVIRKCLEPDPARRYQSAADLREDLERHWSNRPLRHVRVPSVRERVSKWGRRHPRLSSNLSLATAALLVIGLLCAGLYARDARVERYKAEAAIHEARAAARTLDDELKSANYLLNSRVDDPLEIGAGIEHCESALARFGLPQDEAWDRRPTFSALPADEQQRVRGRLAEGCVLLARGYGLRARPGENETEQFERAIRINNLAERVAGGDVPRAVWEQRASLLRRRGNTRDAERRGAAGSAPFRTGGDYSCPDRSR